MNGQGLRRRVVLAWLPAVAYTLLIWWLSSRSLELAIIERVPFRDKGVHFMEYAALGFFIAHALTSTWVDRKVGATVAGIAITTMLGLLDELHQAFVPGRQADELDLLADAIGAALGVLLYMAALAALRRVRSRRSAV